MRFLVLFLLILPNCKSTQSNESCRSKGAIHLAEWDGSSWAPTCYEAGADLCERASNRWVRSENKTFLIDTIPANAGCIMREGRPDFIDQMALLFEDDAKKVSCENLFLRNQGEMQCGIEGSFKTINL